MSRNLSSLVPKAVELLERMNQKHLASALSRATVTEEDTLKTQGHNRSNSFITTVRVRLQPADQQFNTPGSRRRITDALEAVAGQDATYFVELE